MAEYRLYFLDTENHVIGRAEFISNGDLSALQIAAILCQDTSDAHSGYMLWQGARQVFATDEGGNQAFIQVLAAKALDHDRQQLVLSLEEMLLNSHWSIARSQRLLEATLTRHEEHKLAGYSMRLAGLCEDPKSKLKRRGMQL